MALEPYNLTKGNSVFASISAANYYGTSPKSNNGNGAIMIIIPDPPILLTNNASITNRY